ncbi:transglycosylase domain-containing protein [Streptomyces sp. NBC_01803]|uniref:transglycosylase domain-containing protein n=1 Tax=Streptomyces sp. NBC_01803 TaxID=2975946 RepID=UPI002DD886C7|nr:transglycosylase domain-containing protein [Streptomyces sp. NBC_01803]WSA45473.1 transglycosylase domain-containing protein [Streptomyces sp. NBC_01803]
MGRRRPGGGSSATQQAAKFLGVSVLSGAVLAGLALPAVGALGLAARGTMEGFDEIPAMMEQPPLSQKTTILDAEGGTIAEVYSRNRTVVPLEDMSEYVREAIVAIEDARFYEHGAVDLRGILRALSRNVEEGGVAEGASTLTQQYVKNVFVEAAGDNEEAVAEATTQTGAAGLGRKIREMKYAIQLEQELTKDEILENYLNITYFGQQAYGIEAAARRYFSKSAADLELHEAALLAGLVQSPTAYDPVNDDQAALDRRNTVLTRMVGTGDITQAEADEAMARDLGLNVSEPRNGCITAVNDAGFFCDYVREEFLSNPVFGETPEERGALWQLGGLTIQTTLDPGDQQAAAQAARDHVYEDDEVAAAVVQVQPGTGHILSMAQSRPYGNDAEQHQTVINLNVSYGMGGSSSGFQPGSTFKPFTAAAALEQGISPAQEYTTDYEHSVPFEDFRNCENVPYESADGPEYELTNEREDERGTWDMTSALAQSINTYFVELERQVGLCETITMAGRLGVERGNDVPLEAHPSVTLGGQETTPLMMANAYATFANRGTYCEPVAITAVTDADGEELTVPESECTTVMSEHTADTINVMLGGVVEDGTGAAVGLQDRDNAGKTGTTDNRADVWFVGYTPDISTAVHVGSDTERMSMENLYIGGRYFAQASGAGVAGPIWSQAMTGALADVPASSFNEVDVPRGNDRPDRDDDDGDGNGNGNGGDNNGNDGGNDGDDTGDIFGDGNTDFDDWPDIEWPPDTSDSNGNGSSNGP